MSWHYYVIHMCSSLHNFKPWICDKPIFSTPSAVVRTLYCTISKIDNLLLLLAVYSSFSIIHNKTDEHILLSIVLLNVCGLWNVVQGMICKDTMVSVFVYMGWFWWDTRHTPGNLIRLGKGVDHDRWSYINEGEDD